ncbi:MAG: hypothetical protein JNM61_04515 [Zoogloeaceae bacterium]|nr:hypothetical protein [Zoogloeaceae bacterium]
MDIAQLRDRLNASHDGSHFLLDAALLADAGWTELVATALDATELQFAGATLAEEGDAFLLQGAGPILGLAATPLTARIWVDQGEPHLLLTAHPAPGWHFRDSFPDLPGSPDAPLTLGAPPASPLDALAFSDATLVLASHPGDNLPRGLSFEGTLDLLDPTLAPLGALTGALPTMRISGSIHDLSPTPVVRLAAPIPLTLQIGAVAVEAGALKLTSHLSRWTPSPVATIEVAGQIRLGAALTLALTAELPLGGDRSALVLQGRFTPPADLTLTDLAEALGLDSLTDALPPALRQAGQVRFASLGAALSLNPVGVHWLALSLDFPTTWTLIDGQADLQDLRLAGFLLQPGKPGQTFQATLDADLRLGGIAFSVSAAVPGLALHGELAPEAGDLKLGALLERWLPSVENLPDLALGDLLLDLDPGEARFSLEGVCTGTWPLPTAGATLAMEDLRFRLAHSATGPSRAAVSGLCRIGERIARVNAAIEGRPSFALHADRLSLADLATALIGAGAASLPALVFSDIAVELTSAGDFTLTAGVTADLAGLAAELNIPLPAGIADIHLSTARLTFERKSGAWELTLATDASFAFPAGAHPDLQINQPKLRLRSGSPTEVECDFILDGRVELADGVSLACHRLAAGFAVGTAWRLDGEVTLTLLDQTFSLEAAIDRLGDGHGLFLRHRHAVALPIPGATQLQLGPLALSVGQADGDARGYRWGIGGEAALTVPGVFAARGSLALEPSQGGPQLALSFAAPEIPEIPLLPDIPAAPRLRLTLGELAFRFASRPGRGQDPWSIEAAATLAIIALPELLTAYLPDSLTGAFRLARSGAELAFDVPPEWQPTFPELAFDFGAAGRWSLGRPTLTLTRIALEVGQYPELAADLHVGLPYALNTVFGKRPDGRANVEFLNDAFDLRLVLGRQLLLRLRPPSSPFKALRLRVREDGTAWSDWDLGDYGRFAFQVPEFAFAAGRWRAAGGVEIQRDPRLPLRPLKWVLARAGVPAAALDLVPDSLPLRGVDLTSPNLHQQVRQLLGPEVLGRLSPTLSEMLEKVLGALLAAMDRLPTRMRDYLNLTPPRFLQFEIEVDGTGGGTRFALRTDSEEALRLIVPSMAPLPELVGISLRKLAIGQKLGGGLFLAEVDGHIDRFDLISLTAVLAGVPGRDLSNRFFLEDTHLVIPAATPLPVPLFYRHLGWEYRDLLGLRLDAHWHFPYPDPGPAAYLALLGDLMAFFSEPDYLLHTHPQPAGLPLDLTIGRNTLSLPAFLGGATLGLQDPLPEFDVYGSLARVLDAFKTGNAGYVIEAVPLKVGPPQHPTWIRVNEVAAHFGPMKLSAAWCITTEPEFTGTLLPDPACRQRLARLDAQDVLDALPSAAQAPAYRKGFVVLLGGGWEIAGLTVLQARFGLALTRSGGFQTGFRLTGAIPSVLELKLGGDLTLNPAEIFYRIRGHQSLALFGARILDLEAELLVTNEKLQVSFDLGLGGGSALAALLIVGRLPSGRTGLAIDLAWFDGASRQSFELGYRGQALVLATAIRLIDIPRIITLAGEATLQLSARDLPAFSIAGEARLGNGFLTGRAEMSFSAGTFALRIGGAAQGAGCVLTARGQIAEFYRARFSVGIEFDAAFLKLVLQPLNNLVGDGPGCRPLGP